MHYAKVLLGLWYRFHKGIATACNTVREANQGTGKTRTIRDLHGQDQTTPLIFFVQILNSVCLACTLIRFPYCTCIITK